MDGDRVFDILFRPYEERRSVESKIVGWARVAVSICCAPKARYPMALVAEQIQPDGRL